MAAIAYGTKPLFDKDDDLETSFSVCIAPLVGLSSS
jgi:hypothetical protein